MGPSDKPVTAYPWKGLTPQDQTGGPGLDSRLTPTANFSQLEFWDEKGNPSLQEYEGRGLLKNKAALITGGDSGIGRAVAICFAREGADVTICYLAEEEEDAQVTKKEIEKAGRRCELTQGNIREESFCKNAVETHVKDINLESVEKTYRTNILGMFCMTKYALQHMKRGDNIVNSTSVASYMGNPELVDYASTKGAITQFTKS